MSLLPAWFTERMMNDQWVFGLLVDGGRVVAIRQIDRVVQDAAGDIWLDCEFARELPDHPPYDEAFSARVFTAPNSRLKVSIRADKIVGAFEIEDS